MRLAVGGIYGLAGFDPVGIPLGGAVTIICFSVGLSMLNAYRLRERIWLMNLGVGLTELCLMFAAPAVLGELTIRLLQGVLS